MREAQPWQTESHKAKREDTGLTAHRASKGQEPEGHPLREAGKRLITQGDKLSQLLWGSSLADGEVKTEPTGNWGRAVICTVFFHTYFYFIFVIWKCPRGAGKCRLEKPWSLRRRDCDLARMSIKFMSAVLTLSVSSP